MLVKNSSRQGLLRGPVPVGVAKRLIASVCNSLPLAGLCAVTALWSAPPVLAADSGSGTNTASGIDSGTLQEVVVTAQKRAQNIQNVGIAMTALGSDQLSSLVNQNFAALANLVPSLQVQEYSPVSTILNIRGVATADFNFNQEAAIAFYNDEVYISNPGAIDGQLFDVKQEQILRGPQGTLFGRNATGGAVEITADKPTPDFEGGVSLTSGSYGQFSSDGFISGPLSGSVRGRLAFSTDNNSGYMRDYHLGRNEMSEKQYAGRGVLDVDVGSDGKLEIELEGIRNPNQLTNGTTNGPSAPSLSAPYLGVATGRVPDPFANNGDFVGALNRAYYLAIVRYDQGLGNAGNLTSLSSFQRMHVDYSEDYDASPDENNLAAFTKENFYQWSQELHLAGKTDRLNWIVGLYGLGIHVDMPQYTFYYATTLFGLPPSQTPFQQDTKSVAVFGQTEYKLSPLFTGMIGLRGTTDWKSFYLNYTGVDQAYAPLTTVFDSATAPGVADRRFANYSGKIELDAHPQQGTLLYVSVNRGIKGGGFTIPVAFPVNAAGNPNYSALTFDQEVLIDYEGGFKLSTRDNKMTFDGSIFHYDYKNYQAFTYVSGAVLIENLPADITGAELEVKARPISPLEVSVFGTSLAQAVVRGVDVNGLGTDTRMLRTPKWSFGGSVDYTLGLGALGSLQFETDWKYDSAQYEDTFNAPANLDPSRAVGNARLTFTPLSSRWDATLFVNNVTNNAYRIYAVDDSTLGFEQANYAPPRWFGGTLTFHF